MSITVSLYGLTQEKVIEQAGADVNLLTGTVELSLHTDAYSPNRDTHDFMDDVSNELAGNGYARQTLGSKTITYDSASDQVRFDCADPSFPFSALNTWRFGVGSINTAGAASTDPLYFLMAWDSNQSVSTPYTLVIDPAGLLFWDTT